MNIYLVEVSPVVNSRAAMYVKYPLYKLNYSTQKMPKVILNPKPKTESGDGGELGNSPMQVGKLSMDMTKTWKSHRKQSCC